MILSKDTSIKKTDVMTSKAAAKSAGEALSRLKRRVDTRCEDFDTQLDAARRDVASVVVLGYN